MCCDLHRPQYLVSEDVHMFFYDRNRLFEFSGKAISAFEKKDNVFPPDANAMEIVLDHGVQFTDMEEAGVIVEERATTATICS
jgi:hypothetical protein